MKRFVCLVVLLLITTSAAIAQGEPGDRAAAFSLVALDGKSVRLDRYKGKVVLVNFWATWCSPCQSEIPRFNSLQRKYAAKGFQVIGISMDDSDAPVRSFAAKVKTDYPIAMGTTSLAKSYGGVLGLPVTFLVDRDGRIVKRYEGGVDLDSMERDIASLLAKRSRVQLP